MNGWESGLIVAAVMVTLSILVRSVTNKANEHAEYPTPQELPAEFHLASWVVNFYRIGLSMSLIGAVTILARMEPGPPRNVAMFLPAFFASLTGLGLLLDTRKKVKITSDAVSYQAVYGSFEVPLHKIRAVRSANGYIAIDTGGKTRQVIPMIFQGNGQILATLQSKAQPEFQGQGHQG